MPIRTNLWKVGEPPQMLRETKLASEQLLEDMIVRDPRLLSDEWLLVGRQEHTGLGGIIDLLALAPDTVCKPTSQKWRTTVERLKSRFQGFDGAGTEQIVIGVR